MPTASTTVIRPYSRHTPMHSHTWSSVSHKSTLNTPVAHAVTSQTLPQLYRRMRVRAIVRRLSASTTSARFRYSHR